MSRGRILCICSPGDETETLRALLKPVPVQSDVVHGVQAARSLLRHKRFHAVIVTPGAASEDGSVEDLMVLLKNHADTAPAIVVAKQDGARLAERFHAAGVFDVMIIPADRQAVVGVVRRALLRSGLEFPQDTTGAAPTQPVRPFPFLVGTSEPMQDVRCRIAKAAASDANVCVFGETGTGKELVARAIHYSSPRANRPMMVFDCTAIPDGLMESELFGHVKGAFTSAVADRDGVFQLANGGSLLLDEIGELSPPLQAKLLRVIQSREFRKVGGKELLKADVRIIAATHKDLAAMARAGTFREDLFYRLDVLSISVPPLRERPDDIPLLVDHCLARFNRNNPKQIQGVHPQAMGALLRYHWPGNIRQLENCLERAAVMADGPILTIEEFSHVLQPARLTERARTGSDETVLSFNLKEAETDLMRRALRSVGGDKARAAELLGISLRTLYYKLQALEGAEIPPAGSAVSEQADRARPTTPLAAGAARPRGAASRSRSGRTRVRSIARDPGPGVPRSIPCYGVAGECPGPASGGIAAGHRASGTPG